ncbi:uncharacterized protein LOC128184354 isoform X2 [Crassostrea angulata]|uniref:uncharacterized protein LOC128184354 isoform X2 n=1 Tax=Magallana angulata TaxID=2784310 RepID=UPI0022B1F9D5|nr:uncharacterized protein LOC128184354 isoform X2 [Crassostrea angulata]
MSAIQRVCVFVFLFVACTEAAGEFCKDIDENACKLLLGTRNDMCQDSCFADVCRKTCNMCPLVCYQCNREFYPEMCKKKIQCNDTQMCVASQELSVDFLPVYVSGCMEKQTCLDIFGEINTGITRRSKLVMGPKRDYALNGSCCDHDLCNEHDPQNTATELPSTVVRPTAATVQYDNTCELSDMNTEMCRNLSQADPNLCSRPCFAQKICPTTCQTCRMCYKCVNVNDPTSCVKSQICNKNQQCIVLHTLDDSFNPTYKLGCADTSICQAYFGGVGTSGIVGVAGRKRREEGLAGHCCDTDYCNGPPPTTTPKMTTSHGHTVTQTNNHTSHTKSTVPTTTLPIPTQTTFAPDPACKDISSNCGVVSQSILCSSKDNTSRNYAIENCPSTCHLCKEYEAWVNSQVSTTPMTTPFPCVDELPSCSVYGPVFCLDTTPATRHYVIQYCALTCNVCKEYFAYKQQHGSISSG